ncbi:MAG: hypothetical protein QXG00_04180 [Candidatus Woesearchaeota archaeon]
MDINFGKLNFQRLKSNLAKQFFEYKEKQKELENQDTVEKSVQFVKTEKELYDKVSENIEILNSKIAEIKGSIKNIRNLVGQEPTEELSYFDEEQLKNIDDDYEYFCKIYKYENSGEGITTVSNSENNLTNIVIANSNNLKKNTDDKKNVAQLKSKHNSLIYDYRSLLRKKFDLNTLKRNLDKKSNRKITLDFYELKEYGF